MPATEDLLSPGGLNARRAGRRAKRWRRALITLAVLVTAFGTVTARLFIWPDRGTPGKVSAIVMLDGPGDTLGVASRLAARHRAPFLVLSLGTPASGYGCPRPEPRVTLICFNPRPATTQGEAEFVGRLARKYQWRSLTVVAITPQASRARLRVERCFAGPVYVATAPVALRSWPHEIAYEWAALFKALVMQPGC